MMMRALKKKACGFKKKACGFKKKKRDLCICFMYTGVLPACKTVYCVSAWCLWRPAEGIRHFLSHPGRSKKPLVTNAYLGANPTNVDNRNQSFSTQMLV